MFLEWICSLCSSSVVNCATMLLSMIPSGFHLQTSKKEWAGWGGLVMELRNPAKLLDSIVLDSIFRLTDFSCTSWERVHYEINWPPGDLNHISFAWKVWGGGVFTFFMTRVFYWYRPSHWSESKDLFDQFPGWSRHSDSATYAMNICISESVRDIYIYRLVSLRNMVPMP